MENYQQTSGRPAVTVTAAECQAWRTLADEYTEAELAFMFEVARTTVHRHVTGDCGHAED